MMGLSLYETLYRNGSTKATNHECMHYPGLYEQYLKHRKRYIYRMLEIGVQTGASILSWHQHLNCNKLVGIDISTKYLGKIFEPSPNEDGIEQFKYKNITVYIGSQSDTIFLDYVAKADGPFDLIIDDGSHRGADQKASFEHLFVHALAPEGLYVIEDLGTSYWEKWGGGEPGKHGTGIAYVKDLLDSINFRFHRCRPDYEIIPKLEEDAVTALELSIAAIHVHRGICFIEKGDNSSV